MLNRTVGGATYNRSTAFKAYVRGRQMFRSKSAAGTLGELDAGFSVCPTSYGCPRGIARIDEGGPTAKHRASKPSRWVTAAQLWHATAAMTRTAYYLTQLTDYVLDKLNGG